MPPEPSAKSAPSRKRSLVSKRGAIACVRCKERKAKCVPAPPGTSNLPTCTNCFAARAECVYLERTPNELFLLEYVSQLEARIAALEIELSKYTISSEFTSDHGLAQTQAQAQAAAVDALTKQFPPGTWPALAPADSAMTGLIGAAEESAAHDVPVEVKTEPEPQEEDEEDLARGIGLLSLSGSGEPVYVGASSGINWARVCATALRRPDAAPHLSRWSYLAPPESSSIDSALSYSTSHPIPPLPSPPLAARYLDAAYQYLQARTSFFDWTTIRTWHENREPICLNRPLWGVGRGADHPRNMAAFTLWLLYGFGARLVEDEHLEGSVSHEVYHNAAVACLSNVAAHHSLATVQAELLLTMYSFHHPHPEISVWHVGGLALRTAIQIGLHRRVRSRAERERDPLGYETRKRTFWAVYTVDRMLALQLGRPSGIQDRDIDVELPLNVDVDYADAKEVFAMQTRQIEAHRRPGDEYSAGYDSITSMTSCIHNIRLNQLKQLIQDAIYRLDTPIPGSSPKRQGSIPEVDELLAKLAQWRACNPVLPPGRTGVPLLPKDVFDLEYYNCVQMLLRPVIAIPTASRDYAVTCAESAASYCEIQATSLQTIGRIGRISNWALYRLFLSGLTLLQLATGSAREYLPGPRASIALHRCKDALQVFVEGLPGTKGYLECFGDLLAAWEKRRNELVSGPGSASAPALGSGLTPAGSRSVSGMPIQLGAGDAGLSDFVSWVEGQGTAALSSTTTMQDQAFLAQFGQSSQAQSQSQLPARPDSQASYFPSFSQGPGHAFRPGGAGPSNPGNPNLPSAPSAPSALHHHLAGTLGDTLAPYPVSSNPTPLLGSPKSTEAFSDQWAGRLGEMGGRLGGGMRDDFFSLLNSLGVDLSSGIASTLPPIGEEEVWADWTVPVPSTGMGMGMGTGMGMSMGIGMDMGGVVEGSGGLNGGGGGGGGGGEWEALMSGIGVGGGHTEQAGQGERTRTRTSGDAGNGDSEGIGSGVSNERHGENEVNGQSGQSGQSGQGGQNVRGWA